MRSLVAVCVEATIMFAAAHTVLAKAPTVRITITGDKLASPIQITAGPALAVSAWGSEFLDSSKDPLTESPKAGSTYEVTFYSRIADNDIRKTCVVFYSPDSAAGQGFVYLPGKGTIWLLNTGTLMRRGREGRWNYVAHPWEALVKPLIMTAEAEGAARAWNGGISSGASNIVIESWTKPRPGWLYILDPRSEPNFPGSRIWLLDPETSSVKGSVRAGYQPDFALSPDGSRLYIACGERESGELAVLDTTTGTLRQVAYSNRVLYKPWYQGLPPYSGMSIAADGRALWIPGHHVYSPEKVEPELSTFDTRVGRFLTTTAAPANCGYGNLVASPDENELAIFCKEGLNRVRLVHLDAEYRVTSSTLAGLPWPSQCGASEGFFLSKRNKMAVVRDDGAIYEMDQATQKIEPTAVTGNCRERTIAHVGLPRSADGAKVYLGYGDLAPDGLSQATGLGAFDTATWKALGRVQTSIPFWSAVAATDGRNIYAIAPAHHRVLVIDAVTLQEKRAISVGHTPSLALVVP